MFDAGVRAYFTASRLAVPAMLARGSGLVVTVSAGDGERYRGSGLVVTVSAGDGERYRGSVPYDVAKAAAERLGRAMAHELRAGGVASVVVQPGFTRTERVVAAFEAAGEPVPETTHSPEFVGRVVAALAADPDVLARSGTVAKVAALAREYDVVDVDDGRPEPFELDTDPI
jgi:NAD(P)-dependent dehydrogenase (short-subunit alcohol dehydrogenase family)